MDAFQHENHTIDDAKHSRELECVVEKIEYRKAKNGAQFVSLHVTDGVDNAKVQIWQDVLARNNQYLTEGAGLYMVVDWNEHYHSFTLSRHSDVLKLKLRDENANDTAN